jgi:hypothetical protein
MKNASMYPFMGLYKGSWMLNGRGEVNMIIFAEASL